MRFLFFILICLHSQLLSADQIFSPKELETTYELSKKWFLNSFTSKGLFHYIYDPHLDSYSTKNNAIRQLMASRLLAEMSQKNPQLLALHKKNVDFILKNWVVEKQGLKLVYLYKKSKLGANAMLLRTLVASPLYQRYKDKAEAVKNAVVYGINKNGSMNPFLVEPGYEYDRDYLLTFYSGEALVALIEYYEKTKNPQLLKTIKKSQDFYIDRYVNKLKSNYYPAYVPWHTIALNKLYKITGDKKYAKAIFVLNDKLLEIQDRTEHIGRFYNPATPHYGSPHASSDGVYAEGLVYALEIARSLKDQHRINIYKEAVQIAFLNISKLQYRQENSTHLANPQKAIGAFRIRRTSPEANFSERPGSNIRIDSVQHSMDAFRKYLTL